MMEQIMNTNNEYTPEQWARWANYKSNKDLWIEQEERELERKEEEENGR